MTRPKILLIHPNVSSKIVDASFPFGLAYLGAVLKKNGYLVKILDLGILNLENDDIITFINKFKPDLIGITTLSYYYEEMKKLCNLVNGIPKVIGGIHVSSLPRLSLKECNAKYAVIGEGEETIVELVQHLTEVKDISKIKGLAYKNDDNEIVINEPREPIKNLDDIPFPAWELIDIKKYQNVKQGSDVFMGEKPVLPIITSRGCPFKCTYCASTHFWGKSIRFRSIENVINEIEYFIKKYKIKEIEIWDDNFSIHRKRVVEFCRKIINSKIKLRIACPNGLRIDSLDEPLLKLMRAAGFYAIAFPVESGSQKILNLCGKKLDLTIVPGVIKIARKLGYICYAYFILGLPGENRFTAHQTIRLARSLDFHFIHYFIFTPLPGSELFNQWKVGINLSKIEWSLDFYKKHLEKKDTMCDLTVKELKKFQKLGYIRYVIKPKSMLNYFEHIKSIRDVKKFMVASIRSFFKLLIL